MTWLLLISQLPARPAYLRVKLWRRLREIGAVPLKNAVHILPLSAATREMFKVLLREIEAGGGSGVVAEAAFDDRAGAEVRSLFQKAREADYRAIEKELRALAQRHRRHKSRKPALDLKLAKVRRRLAQVAALDFFGASGRDSIEALLTQLGHSHITRDAPATALDLASLKGRQWVTRQCVHVDRIACAWLILRFIDANAKFRFVADRTYRRRAGEVRFDMPDAEFTHEGDWCSFETLLQAASPDDPALQAIAEMVHDLDLEDGKFGRPEAPGLGLVISGICETQNGDMDRITRGSKLLDDVYARLRRKV